MRPPLVRRQSQTTRLHHDDDDDGGLEGYLRDCRVDTSESDSSSQPDDSVVLLEDGESPTPLDGHASPPAPPRKRPLSRKNLSTGGRLTLRQSMAAAASPLAATVPHSVASLHASLVPRQQRPLLPTNVAVDPLEAKRLSLLVDLLASVAQRPNASLARRGGNDSQVVPTWREATADGATVSELAAAVGWSAGGARSFVRAADAVAQLYFDVNRLTDGDTAQFGKPATVRDEILSAVSTCLLGVLRRLVNCIVRRQEAIVRAATATAWLRGTTGGANSLESALSHRRFLQEVDWCTRPSATVGGLISALRGVVDACASPATGNGGGASPHVLDRLLIAATRAQSGGNVQLCEMALATFCAGVWPVIRAMVRGLFLVDCESAMVSLASGSKRQRRSEDETSRGRNGFAVPIAAAIFDTASDVPRCLDRLFQDVIRPSEGSVPIRGDSALHGTAMVSRLEGTLLLAFGSLAREVLLTFVTLQQLIDVGSPARIAQKEDTSRAASFPPAVLYPRLPDDAEPSGYVYVAPSTCALHRGIVIIHRGVVANPQRFNVPSPTAADPLSDSVIVAAVGRDDSEGGGVDCGSGSTGFAVPMALSIPDWVDRVIGGGVTRVVAETQRMLVSQLLTTQPVTDAGLARGADEYDATIGPYADPLDLGPSAGSSSSSHSFLDYFRIVDHVLLLGNFQHFEECVALPVLATASQRRASPARRSAGGAHQPSFGHTLVNTEWLDRVLAADPSQAVTWFSAEVVRRYRAALATRDGPQGTSLVAGVPLADPSSDGSRATAGQAVWAVLYHCAVAVVIPAALTMVCGDSAVRQEAPNSEGRRAGLATTRRAPPVTDPRWTVAFGLAAVLTVTLQVLSLGWKVSGRRHRLNDVEPGVTDRGSLAFVARCRHVLCAIQQHLFSAVRACTDNFRGYATTGCHSLQDLRAAYERLAADVQTAAFATDELSPLLGNIRSIVCLTWDALTGSDLPRAPPSMRLHYDFYVKRLDGLVASLVALLRTHPSPAIKTHFAPLVTVITFNSTTRGSDMSS